MIFFWFIYIVLSFLISYIFSLFAEKRLLKILIFSFFIAITLTVWFRAPGESYLSPVLSNFLLESTILDDNGLIRILRPFLVVFISSFVSCYFFWKKDQKLIIFVFKLSKFTKPTWFFPSMKPAHSPGLKIIELNFFSNLYL